MTLADRLSQPIISQPARLRHPAPKGWEPGVRFDPEGVQTITTTAIAALEGEPDWRSALEDMGVEIPEGYRVRIAEMRFDPLAWTRDDPDQKAAVTKPCWRYRFVVEPFIEAVHVDGIEILNKLKRAPRVRHKFSGKGSFVVNFNDTQLGKDAGGGTAATIERLDRYFDLAVERAKYLGRKSLGELVFLGGGDIVEGCFIYPNQSFQIDLDRRDQVRTSTALILDGLDRLAPYFDSVRVLAVGGNHGEHRINGKRVNRNDNDDCLVFEQAAVAASRDAKLQHVNFTIAQDQAALTMDVQGHILALTHGSVYGKGAGQNPAQKAYAWYKNMAAGRQPVGDADLLVGAHFHHEHIVDFGHLKFVQLPAMDGGSPEFADYSGTDSAPGMATWMMTEDNKFTQYEVLR